MSLNFKAYAENVPEDMILRDHLAFDRTIPANERTVLAYMRTVLVGLVSGLTIIKLFPDDRTLVLAGYLSMAVSGIVFLIGVRNSLKFQKKIKQVYEPWNEKLPEGESRKKRDPLV